MVNLACRLSTRAVDLGEFGKKKEYGDGLLGEKACVCAEGIMVEGKKLVNFGDVRFPVVGCIERYSTKKLAHYHLVALESSNLYLFMTLVGKSVSPWILWLPDEISESLSLLDAFKEFERVLFCLCEIFGVEGGS